MTPYEIRTAIATVTKTPQPLKESLGIISARLKDGFEPWQIIGYMEWLAAQSWRRAAPLLRIFCTSQNLSKWINDGEPLPQASKLNRFKYKRGKKDAKALGEEFRLHATQVEMYLRCRKQLWFLLTKGPVPPSGSLFRGSCFHEVLHTNFGQKMETGEDIAREQARDEFGTHWEKGIDEVVFKKTEDSKGMKDGGYKMVDHYWAKSAPLIDPIASEEKFETDFGVIPVAGKIDRVTEKSVLDDKTAARLWRDGTKKLQPVFYTLAWYQKTKELKPFSFIVTTPSNSVEVPVPISVSELHWYLSAFLPKVYEDIQNGVFTPNPTHPWACSSRWCGWYKWCRGKEDPKAFSMLKRIL